MELNPSTPRRDARDEHARKSPSAPQPLASLSAPWHLDTLAPSCVTFPAHFSRTYKRNSPRLSAPVRAYTGRVSPCAFSRKTAGNAKRPNTCPPQELQTKKNACVTLCHLAIPSPQAHEAKPSGIPKVRIRISDQVPISRRTHAGDTSNDFAACVVPCPASHAASTRFRKSIEQASMPKFSLDSQPKPWCTMAREGRAICSSPCVG